MNNATMLVRHCERDDWCALKSIRLEALRDTPDAYGWTLATALAFSDDQWRSMTVHQGYFLVERDGVVVGMAAGGYHDDRPGEHWLFAMYVTPTARGSGAATALVDAVVAWARGERAAALYLDVTTSLARARAFYRKVGFETTGERRVMDRDPSIELIRMRRSLVST
jgi:GNAT superfamily N-acetyltransferase